LTALAQTLARPRQGAARVAIDAALVVTGSLLIAGLAQISIKLPFTPVPITGQTFGVLLVGAAMGPLLGGLTLALYLAEGLVGLPFFAGGQSATTGQLFSPTPAFASAGYLWGFLAAAVVVGFLARRGWDRTLRGSIGAMLIGEIVIYTSGLVWLGAALDIPVIGSAGVCNPVASLAGCDALQLGLYPFVIGDLFKLLLAAGILPAAWAFARRGKDDLESEPG
jgi:biotin transport system substrate-specific component